MRKSFTLEDVAKYSSEMYDENHRDFARSGRKNGPSALAVRNILQYSKALVVSGTSSGEHLFLIMN